MELFSPGHLIVLAIVVAVLFFGWKQLPDMSRSLGRSLRIFKTEIKGMGEDDKARENNGAQTDAASPRMLEGGEAGDAAAGERVAETPPKAEFVKRSPRPTPQANGHAGTNQPESHRAAGQ